MYDTFARTFMTATLNNRVSIRDFPVADAKPKRRWPWRGRRWRSVDPNKF